MAAVNLKSLKQWYRDSAGVPKKVIAKSRYLSNRFQVRAIRAVWTLFSLPTLISARMQISTNPAAAEKKYMRLVNRNPWISGALTGLITAATRTENIQTALTAALKRDRLLQTNHGAVTDLWTEYLLGESNWFLPAATLTGSGVLELDENTLAAQKDKLSRVPNYTESALAVVVEQIAAGYSDVEILQPAKSLEVVLVGLALGIKPVPVAESVFAPASNPTTEIQTRRASRFEELRLRGYVEVQP